ncbi:MAG: TonB-dependent receptor plug domain-containing protein [Spirochaetaceae bacterium]|jgi:hypothetical protein|nr:TonB-dependent receptor plug domain-containing protein [Spirochaetaceae bacterium]
MAKRMRGQNSFSVFSFRLFVFFCFFTLSAAALNARTIEITVEDADLGLPLEGAHVAVSDDRTFEANEAGIVRIVIPEKEIITIQISYPGYNTYRFIVPGEGSLFKIKLNITQVLESGELFFEAQRSEFDGAKPGRGFVLSRMQLEGAAEIGLVEDLLSSVKLLPGVGYAGLFNALPSIRGGDPGDLQASFDGFYIENPYHWAGVYSIFDPKMVERASLTHGVFSARYGHTVSGVLEVFSKRPPREQVEFEASISTSALNFNILYPFTGSNSKVRGGGVSLFGKLTYWEGFVWLMQGASFFLKSLDAINAVTSAPFIRSLGISLNYRWAANLETVLNSYIGNDGVGLTYHYNDNFAELIGMPNSEMEYSWNNIIGFLSSHLNYNPLNTMILRTTLGFGFNDSRYNMRVSRNIPNTGTASNVSRDKLRYFNTSIQARTTFDWELNKQFLFSAGLEEVVRRWSAEYENNLVLDWKMPDGTYLQKYLYTPAVVNWAFFSSLWTILEWQVPKKNIDLELGLRVDQTNFITAEANKTIFPAFNPRFNINYNIAEDTGSLDKVALTVGTGLFSAMNQNMTIADNKTGIAEMLMTRSWTSLLGTTIAFKSGIKIVVEFYYKYVFDRAYSELMLVSNQVGSVYYFNGYGHIAGVDVLLQKFSAEKLNGWLAYSFNITRYRNPSGTTAFTNATFPDGYDGWYYPEFHRFHTVNLVLQFKLSPKFNLYTRTGFASGTPAIEHQPKDYWLDLSSGGKVHKWRDDSHYSDTARKAYSIPLDIKLSYAFFRRNGKAQGEFYAAVENTLVLFLPKPDNRVVNPYTGKLEESRDNPLYELPIPMISFGFKWSY